MPDSPATLVPDHEVRRREPKRFFDEHADEIAVAITALLLHPEIWISRRAEHITFRDERTLCRQVRVQFEVPDVEFPLIHWLKTPVEPQNDAEGTKSVFFAPIALLDKGHIPFLTVEDANGEALPSLQRQDNELIATRVLQLIAQDELGPERGKAIANELQRVARGQPGPRPAHANPDPEWSPEMRKVLCSSGPLGMLSNELRHAFILIAPVTDVSVGEQRVVTYAYEAPGQLDRSGFKRTLLDPRALRATMGWEPTVYTADVRLVGMCLSYDIDLRLPEDLGISSAQLRWEPPGQGGEPSTGETVEPVEGACHGSTVHLHVEGRRDRGTQGRAVLQLFPRWDGVLMAAFLVTITNAAILGAGVLWTDQINAADDVTAALLLGVPALLGAYLARPGEHRLVSRLLLGVRVLVGASLVLSLIGVGLIVHATGGAGGSANRGGDAAWWVLFGAALAMAAVVAQSVRRSIRLESDRVIDPARSEAATDRSSDDLHVGSAEARLQSGSDIELADTVELVKRMWGQITRSPASIG